MPTTHRIISHGYNRPIKAVDVDIKTNRVRVRFFEGTDQVVGLDYANKTIKVNGTPIIDWYARLN